MSLLAKNYVVVVGVLIAASLALAAWLIERRAGVSRKPARGAMARVERTEHGAVVVLPPHPGVRARALIWTLLPTLFVAYVCFIIDASGAGWALFVGTALVLAAMAACFHGEIFTLFYFIDTQKALRIARGWRSRPGASEPLSPPKQRGRVSLGRNQHGRCCFHHNGREEDGVWGWLSHEDMKYLASLGVPEDQGSPSDLPRWTLSSWLNVLAGFSFLAATLYPVLSPIASIEGPPRPRLSGSFRADHPALGRWNLTPQRCLSGRERGFEGILLQFASGNEVSELRVDMERPGETTLEFRFFEPEKQPLRIARRECERIESAAEASVVVINGRDMDMLQGQLSFVCTRYGLSGQASFRGCLP